MKKYYPFVSHLICLLFIMIFVFAPNISFGKGLVPCGGAGEQPCGFADLVRLANNIIKFLITIGAVLAAISISYAGWLYITGGSDKKNEARAIFVKVFWGFVMMLAAWLIVSLVLKSLGYQGVGIDFLGNIAK